MEQFTFTNPLELGPYLVLGLVMAGLVALADLYFMRNRPRTENLS